MGESIVRQSDTSPEDNMSAYQMRAFKSKKKKKLKSEFIQPYENAPGFPGERIAKIRWQEWLEQERLEKFGWRKEVPYKEDIDEDM